jgi:DNA-binding beta-propeller fold protein YncE
VALACLIAPVPTARAQIVISGNEAKVDLTSGTQKVLPNPGPDSLSILDFAQFPPKVTHIMGVPNSVVGPPSNIAISPDGKVALVANSIKADPSAAAGWSPESYVQIVDLTANPPKVTGKVQTDLQPSGLSFAPDGKFAIVANRAAGTVNVLSVSGTDVRNIQSVKICEPAESSSDVAISPDGKTALVSVQKSGYLAMLTLGADGKATLTPRRFSAYGQPYRVVITSDGEFALTAGQGFGNGMDADALTVIDLKAGAHAPRTVDFITIGTVPESFEASPDGKLVAAVVMDGSNQGESSPLHTNAGAVVLLERRDRTYVRVQKIPVGRIPEGVAFTSDGKYLLVQCHPDRKIWIFRVNGGKLEDTGQRVDVPGMPSSLRAFVPRAR